MDPIREMECKLAQDPHPSPQSMRRVWVLGPVIVGAGPSGLAVAACLKERGIPRLILERALCLGSLWKLRAYDRLRVHLPKQFCQLPLFPFPKTFPTYPTKEQFISYLDSYAKHFNLKPVLGRAVVGAHYDTRSGLWRVVASGPKKEVVEYVCRWLVVATGENAEAYVPEFEGREDFVGPVVHSSDYKSGDEFSGKKVLVVGCGNSGMEVCLDLCNHNAYPSMVVRDSIFPAIKRFSREGAEFVNGRVENFDAIILATGYKSNVPYWLKDTTMFSEEDGYPVKQFPNGWKGENGLYAVGFSKRGLLGASHDAMKIAEDIEIDWKTKANKAIDATTIPSMC